MKDHFNVIVDSGALTEKEIEEAVNRVLRLRDRMQNAEVLLADTFDPAKEK